MQGQGKRMLMLGLPASGKLRPWLLHAGWFPRARLLNRTSAFPAPCARGPTSAWLAPRQSRRTVAPGDVHGQAIRCLEIVEEALREAGGSLADVIRTRVMLTDIGQWRHAARAHAERFAQVRPACTFVEVARFIEPDWLVELEVDAIVRE